SRHAVASPWRTSVSRDAESRFARRPLLQAPLLGRLSFSPPFPSLRHAYAREPRRRSRARDRGDPAARVSAVLGHPPRDLALRSRPTGLGATLGEPLQPVLARALHGLRDSPRPLLVDVEPAAGCPASGDHGVRGAAGSVAGEPPPGCGVGGAGGRGAA